MKKRVDREKLGFLMMMLLMAVGCYLKYFDHVMSKYNTTLYAFSYEYGFTSRGLIGSIYQFLDQVLPFAIMNYQKIYLFNELITGCFVLLVIGFMWLLQAKIQQNKTVFYYIAFYFLMLTLPNFWGDELFGRLDVFLGIITLLCLMLLFIEKCEWLILPMCIMAMCIHHGFVFTNVNIILIILLYNVVNKKQKRKYYGILFAGVLLIVSVFFLYFEFGPSIHNQEEVAQIVEVAKSISENGEYDTTIVEHEILGEDVFIKEWKYHVYNYITTPIFIVMFLPFLMIGCGIFKRMIAKTDKKILYVLGFLGAFTLLPEIILKVDYGRYAYYGIFYYLVWLLYLIKENDEVAIDAIKKVGATVKKVEFLPQFLLLYFMLFMPFYDVVYCRLVDRVKILLLP